MAIGSTQPFLPAGTATLAATTASASLTLAGRGDTVLVTNASGSTAFVRFGAAASVAAGPGDTPVLANSRVLLGVNALITHAAAVLTSGSGPVYFTLGGGSSI
jgi:hypothetical protein